MKPKHTLRLSVTTKPVRQPVTKFGGQPVWVEEPQWPISPFFNEQMLFLGQVALDPALFGGEPGRMAYFFITDPDRWDDLTLQADPGFWTEAFDGENAVIIQPGGRTLDPDLVLRAYATGPGIVRRARYKNGRSVPTRIELKAQLIPGEDPDYIDIETATDAQLQEAKVGGTAALHNDLEPPMLADWTPIMQIDIGSPPFDFELNYFWIAYGLLSPDGTQGALVVQSPAFRGFSRQETFAAFPSDSPDESDTWAIAEETPDDTPPAQPA
jgi:hypothetical protein